MESGVTVNVQELYLQRYAVLYDFWIGDLWSQVPDQFLRQRPDPRVNSIVWNLWHLTRVEDSALNRFVADRPQVLDDGEWMPRLCVAWRHNGSGMTFAEVDQLSQQIDVQALHAYSDAVRLRTVAIVEQLDVARLDDVLGVDHLHHVLFDEGLALPQHAEGLLANYTGWSKGRCLMNLGLTHSFQHVGEIGVIASMLGIEL
jgi:hypothetical protein